MFASDEVLLRIELTSSDESVESTPVENDGHGIGVDSSELCELGINGEDRCLAGGGGGGRLDVAEVGILCEVVADTEEQDNSD